MLQRNQKLPTLAKVEVTQRTPREDILKSYARILAEVDSSKIAAELVELAFKYNTTDEEVVAAYKKMQSVTRNPITARSLVRSALSAGKDLGEVADCFTLFTKCGADNDCAELLTHTTICAHADPSTTAKTYSSFSELTKGDSWGAYRLTRLAIQENIAVVGNRYSARKEGNLV